ncbi:MAG: ATP-dependent DNA helicase [Clostridia bacterium]|nr:ATP-dependent DNA helicase [Clostridia bacterium]
MFLKKISEGGELTVKQLASFSNSTFAPTSTADFVLVDINDTAERIAYSEEKQEYADSYFTDINIKGTFKCDGLVVNVSGIICGVMIKEGEFTVDVVKSVKLPLKYVTAKYWDEWLCQTKCSAYLLTRARNLERVNIRLICVHPESLEKRYIPLSFTKDELEVHFLSLLSEWAKWTRLYDSQETLRNEQLSRLRFPYDTVRDGQDTIIKEVSSAISEHRPVFINAPTGIGKTSAVLYPALKSLADEKGDRIFYLTSKNSLHNVVIEACHRMEDAGSRVRVLSLVSRNKLCPSGKCNRKACTRLKGHSDRLKEALYNLVSSENYITYELLRSYAEKYSICPFELAKHYAHFADVVICDYNYIFDPSVARLDLFGTKGRDVLLVDEAHNLPERIKEMHSATLFIDKLEEVGEYFNGKNADFYNASKRLAKAMNVLRSDDLFQAEPLDRNSVDNVLIEANAFFEAFQTLVGEQSFNGYFNEGSTLDAESVQKAFNSVKRFVAISEELNDSYIVFFDEKGNVRIALVSTGNAVRRVVKKMGNGVFFSATLAPEEYYRHMLGAGKRDAYVNLPSPFSKENFKVVAYSLSTRYSEREATLNEIVQVIYTSAVQKTGNYMVFLPSYSYMSAVAGSFANRYSDVDVLYEKQGMTAADKENYLKRFDDNNGRTLVAFAVMGGSFAEGIDLAGDKLSGAVIVGLGVLPPERSRELTAGYFNDRFFDGVKFAYMYPGMNKVFQAGGRVIRGESDRGFLVVIDDRLLSEDYRENLPESWLNISKASTVSGVENILNEFWKK